MKFDKSAIGQVLFSLEDFVIPRVLEPVKLFFSDYDTRIKVCLRRYDEWWESVYNQTVKIVAKLPWSQV
jgi:hypothetical protein